ncbi:lymphocyte antigen 6C1-like [Apodemus sylvaticus]|uniref:lymphocyte antigen 6C1-like n=1 Tax=Apodemus sylvaticus TaxID=10129 RepID=UPI002242CC69|nr:lymphocyte antigen 6C1-like [Apodemus sylvaticus]
MDSSHATKSCVLILLVALLCAERAQGLKCYHCGGVPLGTSCPSVTCPDRAKFCTFLVIEDTVYSQRMKLKTSQCLSFCPADLEYEPALDPFANMKVSCCQEDLCNTEVPTGGRWTLVEVNAAVPTGGSTWTMVGVLLFSLGSVLLQNLL